MDLTKVLADVQVIKAASVRIEAELATAPVPSPVPTPTPTPVPTPGPTPVPPPPSPSRLGIGTDATGKTLFPAPRKSVYLTAGRTGGDGTQAKPFGTLDQVLIARRADRSIDEVVVQGAIPQTTTRWDESGESAQRPIVFRGLDPSAFLGSFRVENQSADNLAFVGLRLGNSRFNEPSAGLLLERVLLQSNGDGCDIQGERPPSLTGKRWSNVNLRFCRVLDNLNRGGQAQGLFLFNVEDWLLEFNVFDGNGWDATMARALSDPTGGEQIRSHDVYAAMPGGPGVVRNNVFARPASHGIHLRTGGIFTDNLCLNCPIAWQFGFHYPSDGGKPDWGVASGIVSGNVALGADDIRDNPRGVFGIIEHVDGLEVIHNAAVLNPTPAVNNLWSWYGMGTRVNIRLKDNFGFKWCAAPYHRNPPAGLNQENNQFGLTEVDIQDKATIDEMMSPSYLATLRQGFSSAAEAKAVIAKAWQALGV